MLLAGVAVIVGVHWFGQRTALPEAALLTLLGIAYAFLPGPNVVLHPQLVLTIVIPPLLYNAALQASLVGIRRNLRTVVSLSVVLVLLTAVAIGFGLDLFVPGATLAAGIALGAAVAPPDPVAALAVGRKVGLPPRLITLIQGEGLLNDATALTTLTVAVAAATGGGFSWASAIGQFLLAAVGGVVIGVAVAYAVRPLRALRRDPLSANAISLATPFVAYLLGEAAHVSGVLAVVVAGLIIGHDSPRMTSGASRLQSTAVWRLVNFLLEGFVFLLIGQQLPVVVRGLGKYSTSTVTIAVGITLGGVLLIRPLWLVITQAVPASLHTRLGAQEGDDEGGEIDTAIGVPRTGSSDERLSGRELTALSWSGTRGVISLAAIFSLPELTDSGAPFPDRDVLLFCTFVAVLVTLVGQGLTFAPLARALGLRANEADKARLRNQARSASVEAALARLEELSTDEADPTDERTIGALREQLQTRLDRYHRRLDLLQNAEPGPVPISPAYESAVRIRRAAIDAQREELLRWRDSGRLPDEGLRELQRELDQEESLLPMRGAG